MKKIISVLLLLCLMVSTGAVTAFAAEDEAPYWVAESPDLADEDLPGTVVGKLGDSDFSDAVNVKDATAIQKHIADIASIDEAAIVLADADLSGEINIKDATTIQKWVAGIEGDFLVGNAIYLPFALDERLFGTWETTTDNADIFNEFIKLSEDPLMIKHVKLETFVVKQTYTFNADGSYQIAVDEAVLADTMVGIKAELKGDFKNYLEALAKENGMPMSAQEVLTLMGYSSMDELINEMFPPELFEEMTAPFESYYRTAPEGKIYLDEYSDTLYETYTIEGNVLTLTGNSENLLPELYPIVFNKVG